MESLLNMHRFVEQHPAAEEAEFFRQLLNALEHGEPVALAKMYELDYADFELALETLRDWRLHRYALRTAAPQP
ncbi:MAG: hypothetical protein H6R11_2282 [Proteobacteria bacterium]|nr:hypothetical protein [Pseudomonadota bacterium]